MVATINADTTNGVVITSDTSGEIELQANGVTKAKVTANGLQDANGASLRGGSFRNILINGDMQVAQRGTSATGINSGHASYCVDQWKFLVLTAGTWTLSQDTDVPTGQGFSNSFKMQCTTANASLSAGSAIQINNFIEGQNLQHLKYGTSSAEKVTASFWVKTNKTGTYVARLYSNSSSKSTNLTFTIDTANTWEKKTLTFNGDTATSLVNTNAEGFRLTMWLAAGSDFTSGTQDGNTWGTYTAANSAPALTVNLADSTSNYINITGVQLEVGSGASDFEFLPFDVQLARCQRYYEKSYEIQTAPGTASQPGMSVGYWSGAAGTNMRFWIPFKVTKRTSPTVYAWDYAGNQNKCSVWNSGNARTDNLSTGSRAFPQLCSQSMSFNEANLGGYSTFGTHWAVSAEL